jgi:hypothetical protein
MSSSPTLGPDDARFIRLSRRPDTQLILFPLLNEWLPGGGTIRLSRWAIGEPYVGNPREIYEGSPGGGYRPEHFDTRHIKPEFYRVNPFTGGWVFVPAHETLRAPLPAYRHHALGGHHLVGLGAHILSKAPSEIETRLLEMLK